MTIKILTAYDTHDTKKEGSPDEIILLYIYFFKNVSVSSVKFQLFAKGY